MSRSYLIQSIYGYGVCLVAVVMMATSTPSVVSAIVDLTDVKSSDNFYYHESFEEMKVRNRESSVKENKPLIDEQLLREMYDKKMQDANKRAHQKIKRSLGHNLTFLIIGIVLFFSHWRWMKGFGKAE